MGVKDEKQKKQAKAGSASKSQKRKAMYAAQFDRTAKNKRRTLRRHIKQYPDDLNAQRLYAERYFSQP